MSRINEFKAKISLIDFILSRPNLGFQISDTSKKNAIVLYRTIKDGANNDFKSDQILVSRYTNGKEDYDQYFHVHSSWKNNSYSVVDFVHQYVLNKLPGSDVDYRQIFGILDQYIKSKDYVSPQESKFDMKINKPKSTKIQFYEMKDLVKLPTQETFDYLKSRYITPETYRNQIFLSSFGTHPYEYAYENNDPTNKENRLNKLDFTPEEWAVKTKNLKVHIKHNPAFIYLNEQNRIQNFQQIIEKRQKNGELIERKKLFLKGSNKSGTLFKSGKTPKTNLLVINEAPEKCMAHFQLSAEQFEREEKTPYYLATGGTPSDEQYAHIAKIAHEHKFPIVIGYDRDPAGELYSMNTLAKIINVNNHVGYHNINEKSWIGISLSSESDKNAFNTRVDTFNKVFSVVTKIFESFDYKNRIHDPKSSTMYIPNTPENCIKIQEAFSKIIADELKIPVHKHVPITKDWVDDLERKNTLKRDVHIHPQISFDHDIKRNSKPGNAL